MEYAHVAEAPPPPKTISKEWEEASNERALEQKMNPISGLSLSGLPPYMPRSCLTSRYRFRGIRGQGLRYAQVTATPAAVTERDAHAPLSCASASAFIRDDMSSTPWSNRVPALLNVSANNNHYLYAASTNLRARLNVPVPPVLRRHAPGKLTPVRWNTFLLGCVPAKVEITPVQPQSFACPHHLQGSHAKSL